MRTRAATSAVATGAFTLYLFYYHVGDDAYHGEAHNDQCYDFKRSHDMPHSMCYFAFARFGYALFLRRAGNFIIPLFLSTTMVTNTAATASQMNSVHHHENTV